MVMIKALVVSFWAVCSNAGVIVDLNIYSTGMLTVNFDLGKPPKRQEVQLDTASVFLWLSSSKCRPYRNQTLVGVGGKKCVNIPADVQAMHLDVDPPALTKNHFERWPIEEYDHTKSTKSEVLVPFMWRRGYGSGSLSLDASTVWALNQDYPDAIWSTSIQTLQPMFEIPPENWNSYVDCAAKNDCEVLNNVSSSPCTPCTALDTDYQKCGLTGGCKFGAPLGGPIINDVLCWGHSAPECESVTFQETFSRQYNPNTQAPFNGILGMNQLSGYARELSYSFFIVALKREKLFLNQELPKEYNVEPGSWQTLAEWTGEPFPGGPGVWNCHVTGLSTSDLNPNSEGLSHELILDSGSSIAFLPEKMYDQVLGQRIDNDGKLRNYDEIADSVTIDFYLEKKGGGTVKLSYPLKQFWLNIRPFPENYVILGAPFFDGYFIRHDFETKLMSVVKDTMEGASDTTYEVAADVSDLQAGGEFQGAHSWNLFAVYGGILSGMVASLSAAVFFMVRRTWQVPSEEPNMLLNSDSE